MKGCLRCLITLKTAVLLAFAANAAAADPSAPEAASASASSPAPSSGTRTLGVVLYKGFELLDAYGPAEMFGNVGPSLKVVTVAEKAGPVSSGQGADGSAQYGFEDCPKLDLILVPGGFGTMQQLNNPKMIGWLHTRAKDAEIVMSVCSGSALLAKAGLLDGKRATSNKQYFHMAVAQGPKVEWVREARWVDAGDRVTSSGVSAGMDMALAVIARLYGEATAESIALETEYQWHRDANVDPFAASIPAAK